MNKDLRRRSVFLNMQLEIAEPRRVVFVFLTLSCSSDVPLRTMAALWWSAAWPPLFILLINRVCVVLCVSNSKIDKQVPISVLHNNPNPLHLQQKPNNFIYPRSDSHVEFNPSALSFFCTLQLGWRALSNVPESRRNYRTDGFNRASSCSVELACLR